MIVVDASVFVNAFAFDGRESDAAREEVGRHALLEVPAAFGAEVAPALRRLVLQKSVELARAESTLERVRVIRKTVFRFEPFSHCVGNCETA